MKVNFCNSTNSLISTCTAIDVTQCKYYKPDEYSGKQCFYQSIKLEDDCFHCCCREAQFDESGDHDPCENISVG